eukprot:358996-Chlamydomonas_euryale.AAC.1
MPRKEQQREHGHMKLPGTTCNVSFKCGLGRPLNCLPRVVAATTWEFLCQFDGWCRGHKSTTCCTDLTVKDECRLVRCA